MRPWRLTALILAVAAFVLAASGPVLPGFSPEVGRATFFWVGVVCFLAAAWGWRGG